MDTELRRSILKTLAYFDTFHFPLTAEEVYRWLWAYPRSITLYEVKQVLDELISKKEITQKNSFYCLVGSERIVRMRQDAIPLVKEKMSIAKKAAAILTLVPYLRAMYVCNTVAGAVPHADSDIDVFIVVRSGRLWITRAMITVLLSVFRLRRTRNCVHNKICLSFYVTDRHLNLADVQWGEPDIYLAYWVDQLVPVYERDSVIEEIYKENAWVKKWLPYACTYPSMHPRQYVSDTIFSRIIQRTIEKIINGHVGEKIEGKAREWQKKKMGKNIHSLQHLPDSRVVVNDEMLKFHENDRRDYFRQRWRDRCFELHI